MAVPVIDQLVTDVANMTTVVQSAITLINGIQARVQAAIEEALGNGATEQELEPLTALSATLREQTSALAFAVTENTTETPA